jgi:F0F1-type ATP synthase membrane subunit c/vacuolar-type H+-ATPase subunit K
MVFCGFCLCVFRGQGAVEGAFVKGFSEKSIAQGTVEYLVLLGVVVVVSLGVVGLLVGFFDSGGVVVEGVVGVGGGSLGLGVVDVVQDSGGLLSVGLRSNLVGSVVVERVVVDGVGQVFSRNNVLGLGGKRFFQLDVGGCVGGSVVVREVVVEFVDSSGLLKRQFFEVGVPCGDFGLVDGGVASHFVVFSRGTLLGGVVGVGEVAVGLDSGVLDVNHYAFVDWNNSLVGWWRFEESSWSGVDGEVVDESGNNNHGKAFGGASTIANGKFGRGGSFDGVDDYVLILNNASLNSDSFSISFWIKSNEVGICGVMDKFAWDITGWRIFLYHNSHAGIEFDGAGEVANLNSGFINVGEWSHIVITYNGVTNFAEIFLNAISKETSAGAEIENNNSRNLKISGVSDDFNGDIDEVLIFNRALSADEVKSLYDAKVDQYRNDFDVSSGGDYSFRGYAVDVSGNKYETELREFVCVE